MGQRQQPETAPQEDMRRPPRFEYSAKAVFVFAGCHRKALRETVTRQVTGASVSHRNLRVYSTPYFVCIAFGLLSSKNCSSVRSVFRLEHVSAGRLELTYAQRAACCLVVSELVCFRNAFCPLIPNAALALDLTSRN